VVQRITQLIRRAGLPVSVPQDLTEKQLTLAIETDKKASRGKIKFVCIEDIGRTCFDHLTAEEISHRLRH
jgi:3-dehydroquinate synthetase